MFRRFLGQLLPARAARSEQKIARARDERDRGEFAASVDTLSRALQRDGANAEILAELGLSCRALGRIDEARAHFRRAADLAPGWVVPRLYLGNLAHERGQLDAALDAYRAALEIDSHVAELHYNLGLTLMFGGEAAAAVEAFRRCLDEDPHYADARASLLFALNLSDRASAEDTAAEHFAWGRHVADPLWRERRFANPREPQRTLRVGYVSADFFQHAASDFIHSFLPQHQRERYAITCYSNAPLPEAGGTPHGHAWRDISRLDDAGAAALIEQDAIDILVDLSGHTRGNRLLLFARRPAPLQLTFLGYPNTTGMRAMDYRLTDALCDPPGDADLRYRERLLRMPHSLWCYRPPAQSAGAAETLPARRKGHVTFASMNNVAKLNSGIAALWAELLLRAGDARLLLATIPAGSPRQRLLRLFAEKGVDSGRIEFSDRLSKSGFQALHREVDIALDSSPCNGGATTCETLWLGVPVVSLAGPEFRSRAGLSLLSAIGLPGLVAQTPDEYVALACGLAQDLGKLEQLRAGLSERLRRSPLCDAESYTRALERIYRDIWCEWCRSTGTEANSVRSAGPGGN